MATTVYTTETVALQDGTEVTLRPLNIKNLRKFMKKMEEFQEVKTEEDGLEILLDASAICLMKERPEVWDNAKDRGEGKSNGGYSPIWEDVADMPTVYRILDVCGGVKLDDPNLIAAATEALAGKT